MSQAIDGSYDGVWKSSLHQIPKLTVSVLHDIVEDSRHLIDRLTESDHDSQWMQNVWPRLR